MSKKNVKLSDVNVGDSLPDLPIPLTTSLIVGGAVASRDFTPVHHDKSAAQAAGMQDVFMNILTTNGLVGRFVSDWAGPNGLIRQVKIRLGTPNLPGDTMTLSGTVTAKGRTRRKWSLRSLNKAVVAHSIDVHIHPRRDRPSVARRGRRSQRPSGIWR